MTHRPTEAERRRRLAAFLRQSRDAILEAWRAEVCRIGSAAGLSRPALLDSVPELLDHLANLVGAPAAEEAPLAGVVLGHVEERLAQGFDLAEVAREYAILRDRIHALWEEASGGSATLAEARVVDQVLDAAVGATVTSWLASRDRTSRTLDDVSQAALGSRGIDEYLTRLLRVVVASIPAVDTAVVLLREGDRLRARAAVGVEEEVAERFSVRVGEGFAGRLAAERRPLALPEGSRSPLIVSPRLRARGLQALVGVPLLTGDDVLGVMHIGSTSAPSFSKQDVRLFEEIAERATAGVVQHQLRDAAEAAADEARTALAATAQLSALVAATPDMMMVLDRDLRYLFVNPAAARVVGRPVDEMVGRTMWDVERPPELIEQVEAAVARALAGEPSTMTATVRERVYDSALAPVPGLDGAPVAVAITSRDVTDRTSYQQRREREAHRARVLDELAERLAKGTGVDEALRWLAEACVPIFADWCLIERVDEERVRVVALAHPDAALRERVRSRLIASPSTLPERLARWRRILERHEELFPALEEARLEDLAITPERRDLVRELELRSGMVLPLLARDRLLGAIVLATGPDGRVLGPDDLALGRQLAARVALAIDNALLQRERSEEAHARELMLAVVSHDLRNPLAAASLAVGVARRALKPEGPAATSLDTVERSIRRCSRLIDDLLDVAAIREGKLTITAVDQPLDPVVAEAVDDLVPLAAESGVNLRRELRAPAATVGFDRARIVQVLGNLVGNAIKHAGAGSTVVVATSVEGGEVRLTVSDDGPGIAREQLGHVFETWWTAGTRPASTGLGLAIVRGIVEAHGGRVGVESEVGRGATFTVVLPRSDAGRA